MSLGTGAGERFKLSAVSNDLPIRTVRDDALVVLKRLRDAGHVAYFAGGCVRDLLLNLEPADFDIATDAPPDRVRSLFRNSQAVGAAFGVVLVRVNASQIEVATFRADGEYRDGRRPESVRFTSAEEDARRRDFTINGLFLDPISGKVIDYVGGREDLAAGRLRAIGDPAARFAEDHLRLLRAVRFAARFNFVLDPLTAAAIERQVSDLRRISPERVAEELRKMLTPVHTRVSAWRLLWELGLAKELFRQLTVCARGNLREQWILPGVVPDQPIPFGVALATTTLCYQWRCSEDEVDARRFLERGAVLQVVQSMRHTLRISNEEGDLLSGTLGDLHPLLSDAPPTLAMKKRFLARDSSAHSRALMQAMADVGIQPKRAGSLLRDFKALDTVDVAPEPLLNGDHLIASGFPPGPAFKRVLDSVYDAQLEDRISTHDQAIELARQLAGEPR